MNKLITTAFLLMALASVSYGQELIYLECQDNPDNPAYDINRPSRVIVLNYESMTWDYFSVVSDEVLVYFFEFRIRPIVSGTLNRSISSLSGDRITLSLEPADPTARVNRPDFLLDRVTGVLRYAGSDQQVASCSPIDKASLENLLQERFDRRDEIMKEIDEIRKEREARRLF